MQTAATGSVGVAADAPAEATQGSTASPDNPRMSLLEHTCKLRSQIVTWWFYVILFYPVSAFLDGVTMAISHPSPIKSPAATFLRGCTAHCTSHMPHVCDGHWSCAQFCTSGFLASRSMTIETHSNGEQFLSRIGAVDCQPQCEKQKLTVCQSRMSCEQLCDHLLLGERPVATDKESRWSGFIFDASTSSLVTAYLLAGLLCSWLRMRYAYGGVIFQNSRETATDTTTPQLPYSESFLMDTATFNCGMVVFVRSLFECRALIVTDRSDLMVLILFLQHVDEMLQDHTTLLQAPQGACNPPITSRVWNAIFGRHTSDITYTVPYATPAPHAESSGNPAAAVTTTATAVPSPATAVSAVPSTETSKKTL